MAADEKGGAMAGHEAMMDKNESGVKAVAAIHGLNDNGIEGSATFVETENGVKVTARIINASPGKHGFHIHEFGSCAAEGKGAGGHYNPLHVEHGYLPKDGLRHAHVGDMGNIDVDESGAGELTLFLPGVSIKGGNGIAGRAVILHAKPDDFGQPTGNAGSRVACGTIGIVGE